MIYYLICAFFTIFTSIITGLLVNSFIYKDDEHPFGSLIGFTTFLGIVAIVYYPLLTYHLETTLIAKITLGLHLIPWLLGIIFIKRIIKSLKNYLNYWKEILFALGMFIVFMGIYYYVKFPTRTDDLYFYIPYELDIWNRTYAPAYLHHQYSYQIIYNFVPYMGKAAYSIFPMQDLLQEGFIVWYPSIILYWILSFSIVEVMVWLKNRRVNYFKVWLIALIIFVYTIGAYWYLQTPYIGNSFRRVTIIIQFMLLMDVSEQFDWKKIIILTISYFALLAQSSTGFIFAAIMLYGFMLYNARKNNRGYIKSMMLMGLGPVMFITRYRPDFWNPIVWLYALALVAIIARLDDVMEQVLSKAYLGIMIVLPALFGLFTRSPFFTSKEFDMSYFKITPYFFDEHAYEGIENLFEFKFSTPAQIITSIFCVLCWALMIYYVVKQYKKEESYLSFTMIVTILTFFNPWVIEFVMTYITDAVYFRIYDMFFNVLTIMAFLTFAIDRLKPVYSYGLIALIAICFINEVPKNQTWMFMGFEDEDYNALYHVDDKELRVLSAFKSLVKENGIEEPITVMSHIYSMEAFTDLNVINTKNNLITADPDDMSDEALYQRLSYRYEPGLDEADRSHSEHYCRLLQDRDVQYAIIEAQYNWDMQDGLGYCAQQVLEEESYRIFEMHYEWLEWSKPLGD